MNSPLIRKSAISFVLLKLLTSDPRVEIYYIIYPMTLKFIFGHLRKLLNQCIHFLQIIFLSSWRFECILFRNQVFPFIHLKSL